ncbi:MAG: hypothetical protein PUB51_04080, partial [Oscillospiraceae bacterium]|nr:hypothetical protein [Oscillospiraceae bacterium]
MRVFGFFLHEQKETRPQAKQLRRRNNSAGETPPAAAMPRGKGSAVKQPLDHGLQLFLFSGEAFLARRVVAPHEKATPPSALTQGRRLLHQRKSPLQFCNGL